MHHSPLCSHLFLLQPKFVLFVPLQDPPTQSANSLLLELANFTYDVWHTVVLHAKWLQQL